MKKTLIAMAMFAASLASAFAAGFQIVEQGASNIGTALAGAVVNANNDASAAYWNPSAAIFVQSDNKLDAACSFIIPTVHFNGSASDAYGNPISGSDGGNAGDLAVVPNTYYVRKLNEQFALTFSLTSPFGLATKYDGDFVGRRHGIKSEITGIEINPSLVYQVTDWLSVAAGASAQYVNADITSEVYTPAATLNARANGHSWTGSFNVGATVKFLETGRFGIAYRHRMTQDIDGTFYLTTPDGATVNTQPVECELNMPSSLTASVYYRFQDSFWNQFALMLDYAYTTWNVFEELRLRLPSSDSVTPEHWRNINRVSFGMHYYPDWCENLVLRAGMAWDQSPVEKPEKRTPRVPDTNRWWASFGIGYTYDRFNIDLAYTHIFFDNSEINHSNPYNPGAGSISGCYTGCSEIVSVQVGMKW